MFLPPSSEYSSSSVYLRITLPGIFTGREVENAAGEGNGVVLLRLGLFLEFSRKPTGRFSFSFMSSRRRVGKELSEKMISDSSNSSDISRKTRGFKLCNEKLNKYFSFVWKAEMRLD